MQVYYSDILHTLKHVGFLPSHCKKVLEAEDKSDIYIMMAGLDEYLLFLEEISEEEKDKIDKYYEIKKA